MCSSRTNIMCSGRIYIYSGKCISVLVECICALVEWISVSAEDISVQKNVYLFQKKISMFLQEMSICSNRCISVSEKCTSSRWTYTSIPTACISNGIMYARFTSIYPSFALNSMFSTASTNPRYEINYMYILSQRTLLSLHTVHCILVRSMRGP